MLLETTMTNDGTVVVVVVVVVVGVGVVYLCFQSCEVQSHLLGKLPRR
jgi:hypothetical protein